MWSLSVSSLYDYETTKQFYLVSSLTKTCVANKQPGPEVLQSSYLFLTVTFTPLETLYCQTSLQILSISQMST